VLSALMFVNVGQECIFRLIFCTLRDVDQIVKTSEIGVVLDNGIGLLALQLDQAMHRRNEGIGKPAPLLAVGSNGIEIRWFTLGHSLGTASNLSANRQPIDAAIALAGTALSARRMARRYFLQSSVDHGRKIVGVHVEKILRQPVGSELERVGTEKRDRMGMDELVPKLLQASCRRDVASHIEEAHHLAKNADLPRLTGPRVQACFFDDVCDALLEQVSRWHPVRHKCGEQGIRAQEGQLSGSLQRVDIEALASEAISDRLAPRFRRHENYGVALAEAGGGESADRVGDKILVRARIDDVARSVGIDQK
jgi:hypothetical protein